MRNGSKRGIWKYEVNGANCKTNNGNVYSADEILSEFKRRQSVLESRLE